jgi:hypothetical protein
MSTRPRGHPSSHPPLPLSLATTSDGESGNGWKQQIYAQKTDKNAENTRRKQPVLGSSCHKHEKDTRRVSKRFSGLRAARFSQNQRTDFTHLFSKVILFPGKRIKIARLRPQALACRQNIKRVPKKIYTFLSDLTSFFIIFGKFSMANGDKEKHSENCTNVFS